MVIWTTNANGQKSGSLSNSEGQLRHVQDASGNISSYEYDAAGNQTRVIDSAGHEIINQ